jgi:caa(3)-type oxidase subunit IV
MIWVWLVALLGVGLAASALPGMRTLAVTFLFVTALTKALLVVLYYMHLRWEPRLIYAIAAAPLVFVLVLIVGLMPDFVLAR